MEQHREHEGPELCCWSAETAEEEGERIAGVIQQLVAQGYEYRHIGILLRSVRTSSPPLLEALRRTGIPVRCAGRTGLFLQPEAQLFGMTYAWLAARQWFSQGWEESRDVGLKDLLDGYRDVFRVQAKQAIILRSQLEKWKSAAASDEDPANLVRDFYLLLRCLRVHEWEAQDAMASARLGVLARFSELLADFEHVRCRARWVEENGEAVYRGGQSRGRWYYQSLFNYLQYYARDAYEDFEGEETFDTDAVDVLTVHQAKGLEWPVVFLPALVQGRFPSNMAGRAEDWLLPETVFGQRSRQRYQGGDTDERRLFYVAMTRARDMLYLSRFQRIKNRKSASPFLLAVADQDPAVAKTLPLPPPYHAGNTGDHDVPTLAFSNIAAYEDCPFAYRLSGLLGFQPQLAPELGYGKAVHHILRRRPRPHHAINANGK